MLYPLLGFHEIFVNCMHLKTGKPVLKLRTSQLEVLGQWTGCESWIISGSDIPDDEQSSNANIQNTMVFLDIGQVSLRHSDVTLLRIT